MEWKFEEIELWVRLFEAHTEFSQMKWTPELLTVSHHTERQCGAVRV
jgi:hypothetical protein